jgi:type IV secretory pathway VirB10-like protein
MNRSFLVCALIVAAVAASPTLSAAQQTTSSDPYQGTSSPPPDDTIVTSNPPAPAAAPVVAPQPKPSPAHPAYSQPAPVQYQYQAQSQPTQQQARVRSAFAAPQDGTDDGTDDGIVQIAPDSAAQPALNHRAPAYDPDGDIVHPAPLAPGELGEGTIIRVRLLDRLSTADSQTGDVFHSRVASDVLQGGQVLIPAGSEIDGKVMNVSTGSLGGHGSMRLSPDTVILPDGSRYRLYAQVTGTPGSGTRVGNEGQINPGSRLKRDGIEYGGGVGAGVVAGAAIGGPVGALTGSLVGAGLVTVHLLVNHPQAHLEEGTVLLFTLTERLHLEPVAPTGN